jgi:hypothetical protein
MILKPESFGNPIKDKTITDLQPEVLLWRSVIVRTILDYFNCDIHAFGYARKIIVSEAKDFFDSKTEDFNLICDYANLEPDFVLTLVDKLKGKNLKQVFKNKNLNKFLSEYVYTFSETT